MPPLYYTLGYEKDNILNNSKHQKIKPYPPSADVPYIPALQGGVLRNAG
jgi:hypothetical protein